MADKELTLRERIDDAFLHSDGDLAMDLIKEVSAVMEVIKDPSDPEYAPLDGFKQQLTVTALSYFSDKSIEDLFERSTSTVLGVPETVDIIERIKGRLIQEFFIDDRNRLRDRWRAAMQRCPERLGGKNIKLGDQEVVPSIENWLKLYTAEVGSGKATSVKVARFYAQNPGVQALSPAEKAKLKRLVNVFEFLKFRSDDLSGFEGNLVVSDEFGRSVIIGDGKSQELLDDEMIANYKEQQAKGELPFTQLAELNQAYPDEFKLPAGGYRPKGADLTGVKPEDLATRAQAYLAAQRTAFAHRVPATGVPLPNRTAALVAMLHKAMSRGQEADMVLSKEILQFVLADKERFVNFMRHQSIISLLQTDLPEAIGEKNKEVIRQSPTSPLALQALLQIVFLKGFKLSEDEAAWQGFDVIQRLPMEFKDLKTVVTFDPSANKLVWRYG